MGYFDQGATARGIPATVLMPGFQAQGDLQVVGLLQTYLNDEQKDGLSLMNATLNGLQAGNPARSMQVGELMVRKDKCHLLAFEERLSKEETGLLMRVEHLLVYTPYFAIEGDFHMGAATLLTEFMASSHRIFVAATEVSIFPLFQCQAPLIQRAPLVFMHRDVAHMHHAL